ncbi:hypothetical protein AXK11_05525 [Cephaloticoccus primus]|uniref:Uncharacterized protein n=1 Tax=Cephaloticoccus primus TaxID=1548207 RepID=A0A139SMJ0_9BACT|nr:hypothetical protein AXK11_05525 [Cephaloticoccus primus]
MREAEAVAPSRAATIEERVVVLETRWQDIVPNLATKTDLGDLRWSLAKWIMGAIATVLIGLVGSFLMLQGNLNATASRLDTRIDNLAAQLKAEIRDLKDDIRATNARMDRLEEKLDARFEALMAELRDQRRDRER